MLSIPQESWNRAVVDVSNDKFGREDLLIDIHTNILVWAVRGSRVMLLHQNGLTDIFQDGEVFVVEHRKHDGHLYRSWYNKSTLSALGEGLRANPQQRREADEMIERFGFRSNR